MNYKYFDNLHISTKQVLVASMLNQPVGSSVYEEAIKNNPEVFPEEVEYKRKWNNVPKEVKDAYFKECTLDRYRQHKYAGMGIVWYMEHPTEHREYTDWLSSQSKKWKKQDDELYNKYFSKYGLKR